MLVNAGLKDSERPSENDKENELGFTVMKCEGRVAVRLYLGHHCLSVKLSVEFNKGLGIIFDGDSRHSYQTKKEYIVENKTKFQVFDSGPISAISERSTGQDECNVRLY